MVKDNLKTNKSIILYSSKEFSISEVSLKSEKGLRLTGFISSTKKDFNNDIVSEQGQRLMVEQIKERISNNQHITMDLDHESFRDDDGNMYERVRDKIPVALVEDAELVKDGNEFKTKVKVLLNNSHPNYKSVSNSIKNKFLHSFSIAFKVLDGFVTKLNGETVRVIDDLLIRNIGITGIPVNDEASFEVSLKSYLKQMETKEEFKQMTESITELKSSLEEKDKVITELKSDLATSKTDLEKSIKDLKVDEIKSQLEDNSKVVETIAELKSELKELKETLTELKAKPILKAPAQTMASETKLEDVNVFALM